MNPDLSSAGLYLHYSGSWGLKIPQFFCLRRKTLHFFSPAAQNTYFFACGAFHQKISKNQLFLRLHNTFSTPPPILFCNIFLNKLKCWYKRRFPLFSALRADFLFFSALRADFFLFSALRADFLLFPTFASFFLLFQRHSDRKKKLYIWYAVQAGFSFLGV